MIRNLRPLGLTKGFSLSRRYYNSPAPYGSIPLNYIDIAPEVHDALQSGLPVVALESTIITHGMPYPINLTTALSVETHVRSTGAIPATIAILNGRIIVGTTKSQLEYISDPGNGAKDFVKVSRRDLAPMVGLRLSGGTTISATSLIASLVGIKVFSTGGLGGVHRGGEITWDVSADLTELGRTPIAVVSAGIKSILDIPRTLEYLETQGVAVITYGSDRRLPGFYVPDSGYKTPWNVDSPEAAARIIDASHALGLGSGMLIAAPIPEQFSKDAAIIQEAVDKAVEESEEQGINRLGKEATPWILRRVTELSQGKSLPCNVALIENTARIGGQIAVEYAKLRRSGTLDTSKQTPYSFKSPTPVTTDATPVPSTKPFPSVNQIPNPLVVIGGAAMDVICQQSTAKTSGFNDLPTTLPGEVRFFTGGVARNLAEAAHRILSTSEGPLRTQVMLVSPLGNDHAGKALVADCERLGMRTDGLLLQTGRTAICTHLLDLNGELLTGVADMTIMESTEFKQILPLLEMQRPKIIAFDANPGAKTLSELLVYCATHQIPTFFEPTSVPRSTSIIPALKSVLQLDQFQSTPVTFISPNRLELSQMFGAVELSEETLTGSRFWWNVMDDIVLGETYRSDLGNFSRSLRSSEGLDLLEEGIPQMAVKFIPFFKHMFIKLGKHGVLVVMRVGLDEAHGSSWANERSSTKKRQIVAKGKSSILVLKHYPAIALQQHIVNVTGAGDSFAGSLLADLTEDQGLSPSRLDQTIERAQCAAVLSLLSREAISPKLQHGLHKKIVVQ